MELVRKTKMLGRLPVVNFAAGGVATPADAALMMQMGMDGVFVGSGIFKSGDAAKRARAIVQVWTGVAAVPASLVLDLLHGSAREAHAAVVLRSAQAVTHYNDPKIIAEVSAGLGEAMVGIDCRTKDFNSYAARSE